MFMDSSKSAMVLHLSTEWQPLDDKDSELTPLINICFNSSDR